VAVLVSLAMYILSAAALWRLSAKEPIPGRRLFVRAACVGSILFCMGVVLTSKPLLLVSGLAVMALASLAYLWARRVQPRPA